jgi:hypothetical protein
MYSVADYTKLWSDHFAPVFSTYPMPPYRNYVLYEHMYLDYLDLFIGTDTRHLRLHTTPEYPHPFLNEVNSVKRKVKFILVGEARPPGGDYIFNTLKPATPFLNRVFKANYNGFRPGIHSTAKDKLVDLANRGVLIMDLFPFAIPFITPLRTKLCKYGTVNSAWNGSGHIPFPGHIQDKISGYYRAGILDSNWDLALIAPTKISCFILPNPGITAGFSSLIIPRCPGNHSTSFYDLAPVPRCSKIHCSPRKKIAFALKYELLPNTGLITEAFL